MKGGYLIKTLQDQIKTNLGSKMAIGQSRHKAKNQAREEAQREGKNTNAINVRVDTIHSYNSYRAYMEHCNHFVEWCIKEKGLNKYSSLKKIEKYASEYLKEREEKGLSLYTLKAEKAALGKLYGHEIDYKFTQSRTIDKIKRSREETAFSRHFSEKNNQDLIVIAKATGGRREDIANMKKSDFYHDEHGNLWVEIQQSKGGRNRVAPILPQYKDKVEQFLNTKQEKEKLFSKIHQAADIHAYRREYAQELYKLVSTDEEKHRQLSKEYAPRYEPDIKTDTYISHDKEHPFRGLRDNIYLVSEALGHNRLEVTVNHYLK